METNTLLAVLFVVTGLVDVALVYVMRDKFAPAVKLAILGAAAIMFVLAGLLGTGRLRLA